MDTCCHAMQCYVVHLVPTCAHTSATRLRPAPSLKIRCHRQSCYTCVGECVQDLTCSSSRGSGHVQEARPAAPYQRPVEHSPRLWKVGECARPRERAWRFKRWQGPQPPPSTPSTRARRARRSNKSGDCKPKLLAPTLSPRGCGSPRTNNLSAFHTRCSHVGGPLGPLTPLRRSG